MFRNLCLIIALFVAGQATAKEITHDQLIPGKKDLTFYSSGGLLASQTDANWAWGRLGGELAFYDFDSTLVLKAFAEGEIADSSVTLWGLEQELNFTGHSYKLRVGQFLNPAMNIIPLPIKRRSLGVPTASRRFAQYVPGGMLSAAKQMDAGSLLFELALFERSDDVKYDPMFAGFPELPTGDDERCFAYRLELKANKLATLEAGYEQYVGHIFALTGSFWPWLEPRFGMSTFQRQTGEERMNVFFAENTIWLTPIFGVNGRLDFGNEIEQQTQFGAFWKHPGGGLLGVYVYNDEAAVLLSGALGW